MNRIDFLGAHGVGKSTIFAHLVDRRAKPTWLTRIEARRKVAVEAFLDGGSPGDLARAATCYLPRVGDVFVTSFTLRRAERAFVEQAGEYGDFFDHCLRHVTESSNSASSGLGHRRRPSSAAANPAGRDGRKKSSLAYVNLSWLFDRLAELCLLESLPEDAVVFDESLCHATTGMLTDEATDLEVRTHFEKIPLPAGVVHISAPEDVVADRIQSAANPTVRYDQIDDNELHRRVSRTLRVAEIGACTLDWRGADVVSVDATESPEKNSRNIAEFVETFGSVG